MLPIRAIKKIIANDDYTLTVMFFDGKVKLFDMKPQIEKYEVFKPLENRTLFKKATADGGAVIWNEDIDIAQEFVYDHGVDIK